MATIRQCLAALGVMTGEAFASCAGVAEEARAAAAKRLGAPALRTRRLTRGPEPPWGPPSAVQRRQKAVLPPGADVAPRQGRRPGALPRGSGGVRGGAHAVRQRQGARRRLRALPGRRRRGGQGGGAGGAHRRTHAVVRLVRGRGGGGRARLPRGAGQERAQPGACPWHAFAQSQRRCDAASRPCVPLSALRRAGLLRVRGISEARQRS